jgi:hypothetical protein
MYYKERYVYCKVRMTIIWAQNLHPKMTTKREQRE